MVLRVESIIGGFAPHLKCSSFSQKVFSGGTTAIKDEFIAKLPQTQEEIKKYLSEKVTAFFNKAEEKLNETYSRNGHECYKYPDHESMQYNYQNTKNFVQGHFKWGYNGKEEKLKDEFPLYEKIFNNPKFFEQKMTGEGSVKAYIGGKTKELNRYETIGEYLLKSLAYNTETHDKLKLLEKFTDLEPDSIRAVEEFIDVFAKKDLFPEKINLLDKIISTPSFKKDKTFVINSEETIYSVSLEALKNLSTPQQVKLLEQIVDNKDLHELFGARLSWLLPKLDDTQAELFSRLIQNKDYAKRIRYGRSDAVLVKFFAEFKDKTRLEMFTKYLKNTNDMYKEAKTNKYTEIAPFSLEYNDSRAMDAIYNLSYGAQIFNRFLDDENLYKNPRLFGNFGDFLDISGTKEGAKIINAVFDNENLCNDNEFLRKLSYIHSCEKEPKIQKMRDLYHQYTGQYV